MKPLIQLLGFARNVNNKIFNSIIKVLEPTPTPKEIHRWSVETPAESIVFLKERVMAITGKNAANPVLIVSDDKAASEDFAKALQVHSIPSKQISASEVASFVKSNSDLSCIVSLYFREKENFAIASVLLDDPKMVNIPFEYIGNAFFDYDHWAKTDRYTSRHFISPVLHYEFDVMKIHSDSLTKFDLKTDVRDYLELVQAITHIKKENIDGDIAEFGSFKGHSGYLITKVVEANKLNKKVYLFDMFESFPEEPLGIDAFWSKTHTVDFNDVSSKFKEFNNVKLVKGDFTKTLKPESISKLSLVHVDCDSYRATKYLMEELFENVLVKGGIMLFEDYGHPGLLGSRVAIDQFFEDRHDVFLYFSQASGYLLAYKL